MGSLPDHMLQIPVLVKTAHPIKGERMEPQYRQEPVLDDKGDPVMEEYGDFVLETRSKKQPDGSFKAVNVYRPVVKTRPKTRAVMVTEALPPPLSNHQADPGPLSQGGVGGDGGDGDDEEVSADVVPQSLARLVPPNLDIEAQKAWASRRYLELWSVIFSKVPREPTEADRAEFKALNRRSGWFN